MSPLYWIALIALLTRSITCFNRWSFLKYPIIQLSSTSTITMSTKDILFDMPVSNHGARVRMIIQSKGIQQYVDIKQPSDLGGLKSVDYLKLNPQGKMPLLLSEPNQYPIVESDCIARYLLEKYHDHGPSFIPSHIMQRSLSDQICRVLDLYISPVQGSMYKASGTSFSIYGTSRSEALMELKRQLHVIETLLTTFEHHYPQLSSNTYLCSDEISLADVSLYPTIIFCVFMLPQIIGWDVSVFLGPRLQQWWNFMNSGEVPIAIVVRKEIEIVLHAWKDSGRFDPIAMELQATSIESKI